MSNFSVFAGDVLVGYSFLEAGDAPMGVAWVEFRPLPNKCIQSACVANHSDQSRLLLSVKTEAGNVIHCAGVAILDCSAEAGTTLIELSVLGIPYPLYAELFPQHVDAYENQFKPSTGA